MNKQDIGEDIYIRGALPKMAVIMASFIECMKTLKHNFFRTLIPKFVNLIKKGILHFLNATCELPTLMLFSEPVDFV